MLDRETWSWDIGKKLISDLGAVRDQFADVHEFVVSADGQRIVAPVLTAPDVFRVWVNGALWEGEYEKAWHLVFGPDGRLTALVRVDDEWTIGIDGELWDTRWEFAWNPTFDRDGTVIAVQIKDNMEYTVAVNGRPWERRFHSSRGLVVSDDGSHVAALVQVEPLAEADTVGFMEGTWSVAVDGVPWERKFINAYGLAISPGGDRVAAEVRLDICDYTLAENAAIWETSCGSVWEPVYRPSGKSLLAPVRINVIRLELPSLRDRREDIPLLIDHFIDRFNRLQEKNITAVSDDVLALLMSHDFPGNARELENIIEHGFVLCRGDVIGLEHLPPELTCEGQGVDIPGRTGATLRSLEECHIADALRRHHGNRKAAAEELGIHPSPLFRKIRDLGIEVPEFDGRHRAD